MIERTYLVLLTGETVTIRSITAIDHECAVEHYSTIVNSKLVEVKQ